MSTASGRAPGLGIEAWAGRAASSDGGLHGVKLEPEEFWT